MAKDQDYKKLINTSRWLRLRREVLSRHPLCQRCEKEGHVEAASEVHHIRPVEEAITFADKRQRMYDPENLTALCHTCHVKTHTELGRCGKAATQKRNREQVEQVINRFFPSEDETPGGGFLKTPASR